MGVPTGNSGGNLMAKTAMKITGKNLAAQHIASQAKHHMLMRSVGTKQDQGPGHIPVKGSGLKHLAPVRPVRNMKRQDAGPMHVPVKGSGLKHANTARPKGSAMVKRGA